MAIQGCQPALSAAAGRAGTSAPVLPVISRAPTTGARWGTLLLAAGLLAGCVQPTRLGAFARVQVVDGVVLPEWAHAVERHIARACFPGPGPAGGALLSVVVDPFGYVRVAGPVTPGDAGPFGTRVALDLLSTNCGHFSAPETPVRALVRMLPG